MLHRRHGVGRTQRQSVWALRHPRTVCPHWRIDVRVQ